MAKRGGGGGDGGKNFWRLSQTRELKMGVPDPSLSIKRRYPPKRQFFVMVYGHGGFQWIVVLVGIVLGGSYEHSCHGLRIRNRGLFCFGFHFLFHQAMNVTLPFTLPS